MRCETIHFLLCGLFLIHPFSRIADSCGEVLSEENGTVTTPAYPKLYSSNLDCSWHINVTTAISVRLQLWFVSFGTSGRMPQCLQGDYMEILIGCQPRSLGRFCGDSKLPVFYSLDHCMTLRFHSRKQSTGRGFKAYYSSKPANSAISNINRGCGISVFDKSHPGNIFTPMWPQLYPQYVDCLWRVSIREDLSVKLFFTDFKLDSGQCSQSDFLDIRAGTGGYTLTKSLLHVQNRCTRNLPFEVELSHSTFYIKFVSNGVERRRGFMAGFVTYKEAEEEKFEPKVLIMLAIIFGTFLFFGVKAYIQTILRRRQRKCNEEYTSLTDKTQSNVRKVVASGRSLHKYFTQRRSRKGTKDKEQDPAYHENSSQVPQSQSQFQLLHIPQSSTDPDLLSFGQHVDESFENSRPASSLSMRHLAWAAPPSPEKLEPNSVDHDVEIKS